MPEWGANSPKGPQAQSRQDEVCLSKFLKPMVLKYTVQSLNVIELNGTLKKCFIVSGLQKQCAFLFVCLFVLTAWNSFPHLPWPTGILCLSANT